MKKILIVDDELIFRQGIRYMVDWEAYHYTIAGEATNGKEALELIGKLSPDIVLCDIVMPILSGVELVKIASNLFPSVKIVVLSNFDEFNNVRQAFKFGACDYLLKSQISKAELLSCLDKLKLQDKENKSSPALSLAELTKQLLDGFAQEPFAAFDTMLDQQMSEKYLYMLYMERFKISEGSEGLIEEILEVYLNKYTYLSLVTNHQGRVFLINTAQTLPPYIISALFQKLVSLFPDGFCILSDPFYREDRIKAVYEKLCNLAKYSIFFDGCVCFLETDIVPHLRKVPFPFELYREYVQNLNLTAAQSLMLSYIERIRSELSMEPFEFRKIIENIMYNTIGEIKAAIYDDSVLDNIKLRLFKNIDTVYSFSDVRALIEHSYKDMELVCATTPIRADQIVSGIIKFISENYMKPITLYDAAEHMHINYSYLSNYISTNSSMHFSEHLNEIRISHAKRLLIASKHSISEISENIGYTDQSYFGKVFKKSTGYTPLEYRKKHQKRGILHE
jgi:two-component system response regulator YesN